MEKFKKVLKVVLLSLLGLCSVGAIVSYAIIPEQTKSFFDGIREFINQPLPIVGVSIVGVGSMLWLVLSKLGYGKKALNEMKQDIVDFKAKANETKDKAQEYYDLALKYQSETKVILSNYDSKIESCFVELEKVCETMPNAKIKELGKEIKEKYGLLKNELNEKLDNLDTYIESKEKAFDYEKAYNDLLSKVERLEEKYEEREETTNG